MEQELYDIYTMWHVPFWQTSWFFWTISALVVGLTGLLVWFLVQKWRSRKRTQTAWDYALEQIEDLQKSNLMQGAQGKEFYHALTHIMKRYVHERYQIAVLSATDQEFVSVLERESTIPLEVSVAVQSVMQGLQFIKFANAQAAEHKMRDDSERVIVMIMHTIPKKST